MDTFASITHSQIATVFQIFNSLTNSAYLQLVSDTSWILLTMSSRSLSIHSTEVNKLAINIKCMTAVRDGYKVR